MLVPALPVIATQATTGYNDLVAASFVVGATVFVLGRERAELVPFALAVALAVGTKFTTPFAFPIIALAGVLGQPVRRWGTLALVGAAAALLGAGWYIVNLARTGELDGGLASFAQQEPVRSGPVIVGSVHRLLLDSVERPGTEAAGVLVFVVVGLAMVGLGAYAAARGRRGWDIAAAGLAVSVAPATVSVLSKALGWCTATVWDAYGDATAADQFRSWRPSTLADGAAAWYGPLATAVGAAVVVIAGLAVRRRVMQPATIALALAPWIGIVILAFAVTYDPWRGRFLVGVWVMNVAVWGVLERHSVAAASVTAVTAVTFCACLVQYLGKPSGIDALTERSGPSIWTLERWEAQTLLRGSGRRSGERLVLRSVERRVPNGSSIAVAVWRDDVFFPYFGAGLRRNVVALATGAGVPDSAEWVAAAPEVAPLGCADSWHRVAEHPSGWRLYRRVGVDTCAKPLPLRNAGPEPAS
jgi:hypothetical protein